MKKLPIHARLIRDKHNALSIIYLAYLELRMTICPIPVKACLNPNEIVSRAALGYSKYEVEFFFYLAYKTCPKCKIYFTFIAPPHLRGLTAQDGEEFYIICPTPLSFLLNCTNHYRREPWELCQWCIVRNIINVTQLESST